MSLLGFVRVASNARDHLGRVLASYDEEIQRAGRAEDPGDSGDSGCPGGSGGSGGSGDAGATA